MLSTISPQPERPAATAKPVLTSRDMDVFRAIVEYKQANDGCAPGNRDLMQLTAMSSTSVVAHHLAHLVRAGLIERGAGSRQIRVSGGRWSLNS